MTTNTTTPTMNNPPNIPPPPNQPPANTGQKRWYLDVLRTFLAMASAYLIAGYFIEPLIGYLLSIIVAFGIYVVIIYVVFLLQSKYGWRGVQK